jgi:hypothetical protein
LNDLLTTRKYNSLKLKNIKKILQKYIKTSLNIKFNL